MFLLLSRVYTCIPELLIVHCGELANGFRIQKKFMAL